MHHPGPAETTLPSEVKQCTICLEDMRLEELNVYQISCGHWFHRDCILPWAGGQVEFECPMCRRICRRNIHSEYGVVVAIIGRTHGHLNFAHHMRTRKEFYKNRFNQACDWNDNMRVLVHQYRDDLETERRKIENLEKELRDYSGVVESKNKLITKLKNKLRDSKRELGKAVAVVKKGAGAGAKALPICPPPPPWRSTDRRSVGTQPGTSTSTAEVNDHDIEMLQTAYREGAELQDSEMELLFQRGRCYCPDGPESCLMYICMTPP